ncbi:protein of unknown function [Taphrina deformans PYCC 5710]|uniref:CCZ1/INTU/HSP4 first Longin domain-containing protein n=1 Tax=Taphrina deformans (strain PYCC 5710 / ATCC 11124 / CBS 356.35 / IMI 108563 / JCM 9778 / NBRC 8474) TaxID=1097556 RepID=R4XNU3_TAPDE|nr:protein of unknown function [Taphrina deformans PYCC 5710]|eukprot:CCG84935.1 protein of unknown function [Taphrina deformans PYCC 5710]
MSLSYFTIFNPSLGPDEETLPNQLLFYTSSVVSDLDSQLRNIGLVQGIVELGRSFAQGQQGPVDFIKSKDTRSYLQEIEPGYWAVLCFDVVLDNGSKSKELPVPRQLKLQLETAYQLFVLEHGTLNHILAKGREAALKVIEHWWLKWSWSWTADCPDAALLCDGFLQARTRLSTAQTEEIETYRGRLTGLYPECFHEIMFLRSGEYIETGSTMTTKNKRLVQMYLNEYRINHIPTISSQSPKRSGTDTEVVVQGTDTSEAQDDPPTGSWLTGQKWSKETAKVMHLFTFSRGANQETVPPTNEPEASYSWLFSEDREVYFAADGGLQVKYLNALCHQDLTFIVLLNVPGSRERALVREHIDATVSHLATALLGQTPSSAAQPPLFFSLVHCVRTGATTSSLPSLSAAMTPSRDDTALQVAVKQNTVHLHRQIFALWGGPECCTKTAKQIWVLIRRDGWGTIVLAKSGKSGESLEEVERSGRRFMQKLRNSYS